VCGWSTPRLGRFTPGKDPVPIALGGRVGPRAGLDGYGKSRLHRNSIPDRPALSESLYRLSYCGPPRGRGTAGKYLPNLNLARSGIFLRVAVIFSLCNIDLSLFFNFNFFSNLLMGEKCLLPDVDAFNRGKMQRSPQNRPWRPGGGVNVGARLGGWSTPLPGRLIPSPDRDPVPTVQEAVWGLGLIWTGTENLAPTEDSFTGPSSP
jgi:hypothetical protein